MEPTLEDAAAVLLWLNRPHTLRLDPNGWTMAHPLMCRFQPGGLHACLLNEAAARVAADLEALPHDTYEATFDDDGELWLGPRLGADHDVPPPELVEALTAILSREAARLEAAAAAPLQGGERPPST